MPEWNPYSRPLEHPIRTLGLLFMLWKTILLIVALLSPGPGYDTSTLVMLRGGALAAGGDAIPSFCNALRQRLALKLTRWDAIYFVKSAERGYLNEQDWAFSWACTRLMRFLAQISSSHIDDVPIQSYVWAGILVSHASHFMSVLVLHRLFIRLQNDANKHVTAFLAAALHIVTPAGLFLSAPNGEALFSFLNFSGMLLYVESQILRPQRSWRILQGCELVASGASFAAAASIRGNGVLSGLIFVYDIFAVLPKLCNFRLSIEDLWRLVFTVIAGTLIIVGFVGPQWLAYDEYCGGYMSSKYGRPWCLRHVPSIYSWVQSHYWNVGFLNYWTLSNAPLFLIAAPLLSVMVRSAMLGLGVRQDSRLVGPQSPSRAGSVERQFSQPRDSYGPSAAECSYLRRLALPQLVLALMAFTSFHVQIINRIASGYPIWYLFLAKSLCSSPAPPAMPRRTIANQTFIRWMVMYAIVQGSLYANFLPPA